MAKALPQAVDGYQAQGDVQLDCGQYSTATIYCIVVWLTRKDGS
jgi:hypothetical protein